MRIDDLKFTKEHEWVSIDGDILTVGISDYAQKELGDVVYVELPPLGDTFAKGDTCSSIESVKAVSDIYTPVSGEIVDVNSNLEDNPELINQSPYEDGWVFKIKIEDEGELDDMMDADLYDEYLQGILEE
ncbi:MAG: glycine cleavage system protein GcvH [Candidatus Aminicenantes bacterium]|nr:glycine cleavage system protein GcvH [Candidatus Aminicenantes bacterium]